MNSKGMQRRRREALQVKLANVKNMKSTSDQNMLLNDDLDKLLNQALTTPHLKIAEISHYRKKELK